MNVFCQDMIGLRICSPTAQRAPTPAGRLPAIVIPERAVARKKIIMLSAANAAGQGRSGPPK